MSTDRLYLVGMVIAEIRLVGHDKLDVSLAEKRIDISSFAQNLEICLVIHYSFELIDATCVPICEIAGMISHGDTRVIQNWAVLIDRLLVNDIKSIGPVLTLHYNSETKDDNDHSNGDYQEPTANRYGLKYLFGSEQQSRSTTHIP